MICDRLIVGVVMLAMCVVVQAQVQSPASRSADEPATGAITGRVVNENGQALAGATVSVRAVNTINQIRNTTTDLEGNFRVKGLDPALYTVFANAPAYVTEPADPTYYRIGDSARVQLIKGGVITGTVTNASGEPMVGVNVRAIRIRDAQGQLPRTPASGFSLKMTDDRGVYRVYGLVPGTYIVSAGGGLGVISFFNPFDSDIPTFSPSSTRDTATEIVVRAGEESTADIRYRGEQGYSISGKVNVSGNNGATVTLMSVGGTSSLSAFQPPGSKGFQFGGLSDGEYKIAASENSSSLSSPRPRTSLSETKRVIIKQASVTGIELTPKPLESISGRILLLSAKVPECQGKRPPLFIETLIQARRNDKDGDEDEPGYLRAATSSATPDSNGAFVLPNLKAGRYRFEARFYARYWYLQSVNLNAGTVKPQKIDAAATWTTVKPGEPLTNLTVTLAEGAASIRGRVAVAEGSPLTSLVYLVPSEPDKADDVLRYFVTSVGSDGAFTFSNLPPGKYLALTQTNVDAQIETLAKLRQPESAAARTKLRRNAETQQAEIELKPCQNLTDYQLILK